MNAAHWQSELDKFEALPNLWAPTSLQERTTILKALSQLRQFGRTRYGIREGFGPILPRAVALQQKLEATNQQLFEDLRERIRWGSLSGRDLRQVLNEYTTYRSTELAFHHFADGLNALVNGIFETSKPPDPLLDAVIDMIHLEMTPTSVMLEMVDRIDFTEADTFVDIGSGQGQNCLLIYLLTAVRAIGIDIEPAYIERATTSAQSIVDTKTLEARTVQFIQADARFADYSQGSVFFMFTPFVGQIFQQVMAQLGRAVSAMQPAVQQSSDRKPRPLICTYGDITLEVAKFSWLQPQREEDLHPFRLAIFEPSP